MADANTANEYRCSYHLYIDTAEYYKCDDCKLGDVLEPDMTDQFGNKYYRYEEYMEANDGVTDASVIAHDVSILLV